MSKIRTIQINNFKAIGSIEIDFNGCTAIIVGGNNKGKTSLLRGIPDRIRGLRPELIVKDGETEGKGVMTLTTGERFEWEFNSEGKDKLSFFTVEGYKTAVTKEVSKKFFPPVFDIDAFLEASPKDQATMIQRIAGIDFTIINAEYKNAFEERTIANRQAEMAKAKVPPVAPEKVEAVDTADLLAKKDALRTNLNKQYTANKEHNERLRNEYNQRCESERTEVKLFNEKNASFKNDYESAKQAHQTLCSIGYTGNEVREFVEAITKHIQVDKEYVAPAEPEYITELPDDSELKAIDDQIAKVTETNSKAAAYTAYLDLIKVRDEAVDNAKKADEKVKEIETRKAEMLKKSNLPEGIILTENGLLVDGFPLDKNQISTSKLYTAALRLAALNLGDVKTLHFDASPLDKNTLSEIQEWADANEYQLLIERPDFEGGEISYTILQSVNS